MARGRRVVGWCAVGLVAAGLVVGPVVPVLSDPSGCVIVSGFLPDRRCTPGAWNPAVTQETIGSTICVPGWTRTVRPGSSTTRRLRVRVARAYGLPAGVRGELDHLVSLELGGSPDDVANLWIEPGPIPNPKDRVENALRRAVCSGRVPLDVARAAIASDWTTALAVVGGGVRDDATSNPEVRRAG